MREDYYLGYSARYRQLAAHFQKKRGVHLDPEEIRTARKKNDLEKEQGPARDFPFLAERAYPSYHGERKLQSAYSSRGNAGKA